MKSLMKTAGKTAKKQTKWGWGLVSLVGLMAAGTIDGSLIITFIAVAMFGIGAYLGGYMDEPAEKKSTVAKPVATAYAEEGVAA